MDKPPSRRSDFVPAIRLCHRAGRAGRRRKNHANAYAGRPAQADGGNASVLGFDPIQNDNGCARFWAICRRNSVCMKDLYRAWRTLISMPIYAALHRRDTGKRPLPFVWSLRPRPFHWRLAGKLSGGMKQKLGLAQYAGEPKVLLLLDEPGVGVDPISRRELWQMVHELAGDGMR